MYRILNYSYTRAKQLNVEIYPSKYKDKKIDVYKDGIYQCSIGDNRYLDFPNYARLYGLPYALKRRKLYQLRHHKEYNKKGTAGYYAYYILW
jgi:hypothetical protein